MPESATNEENIKIVKKIILEDSSQNVSKQEMTKLSQDTIHIILHDHLNCQRSMQDGCHECSNEWVW